MIAEQFYYFSNLNRNSGVWTLDQVFDWGSNFKVVAMGEEERAYLFSMQLILGSIDLVDFQEMHNEYWPGLYKQKSLRRFLGPHPIFCTDPRFLDYMMDWQGDLAWKKNVQEKTHWSQSTAQLSTIQYLL